VPALATILLIEPDDRLRMLTRSILNRQGYRVIEADCPAIALLLWGGQATNVDLLLTDLVLPDGTSGCALAEKLQQTKPRLKVMYTLSEKVPSPNLAGAEGLKVLSKACAPNELLQAVADSLGHHQA
jgi:CheY-like chemotaxis protein